MLLAIDAGNTNVVFALVDDGKIRARWRIATDRARLADEYAMLLLNLLAAEELLIPRVEEEGAETKRRRGWHPSSRSRAF